MSDLNKKVWDEIYDSGTQLNRYPYDSVVAFVYKNYPKNIERKDIKILEVGCGAGNNLWFAAREGFNVTGVDRSKSAIEYAKKRFMDENLKGKFIAGDIKKLPFDDESFDLVIDRSALSCVNLNKCKLAVSEINRVLKRGGKFFFNPFSDKHSSCTSGEYRADGMTEHIKEGISNVGNVSFYGKRDIYRLFQEKWQLGSIKHIEAVEQINPLYYVHAEWEIIATKL
ncbi:methyltransferase domain-containing protein [Clostridium paridis]|uniref:Class I SAM-dependent methyltransferase n=1 Tax=Clostridium paridis TaxID=2803863 RepID=A0A937FGX2_9CLOT|nr:class I SAM-dependent methyltransferase [Clostridium paridis]